VGGRPAQEARSGAAHHQLEPNDDGFIGGGQLGANFQYRHTVFGFEVDADASSQKTSRNTLTATMSSFATARARIGYAYDRIHYYVTGGGGYVQFSSSGTTTSSTGTPVTTTGTSRRTAWVADAGSESAVTPNVILRFEFLYLQLLENTQNSASATPATSSKRVYNLIGRVGLSYKFGWGGSLARLTRGLSVRLGRSGFAGLTWLISVLCRRLTKELFCAR
jgi:outer membrane immunogenic protein